MSPAPGRPQLTLLRASALESVCVRNHFVPCAELASYVAVAWTMKWDLADDQSFTMDVLPNPCVQIAVDARAAAVVGVVTGAFSATFTGTTFVFGLRFKPCGFQPFAGGSVSRFTDRRVPLRDVLPGAREDLLQQLAAEMSGQELVAELEAELCEALPRTEDKARCEVESLIAELERNSGILTAEKVAQAAGVSVRTLQRLFRQYAGISPKWLIRRYRLKEAAARIEAGAEENWADLAQELGYYDQSHLINDFRRFTGRTPALHARSDKLVGH